MSKSLGNLITPSQLLGSAETPANSKRTQPNSKEAQSNSKKSPSNSIETPSNSIETPSNSIETQSNSKGTQPNSKGAQSNSKKVPTSLLDRKWAVDVLRLWVASSDYTYDISLGLQQLLKVLRVSTLVDSSGAGIVSETSQYESLFALKSFRFRSNARFGSLFPTFTLR